jgi:putative hemolysin
MCLLLAVVFATNPLLGQVAGEVEIALPLTLGNWAVLALITLTILVALAWLGMLRVAFFLLGPEQVALLRSRQDFMGQLVAYLHQDQRRLLLTLFLLQFTCVAALFCTWWHVYPRLEGWEFALPIVVTIVAGFVSFALPPHLGLSKAADLLQHSAFWVLVAHRISGWLLWPYQWVSARLEMPLSDPGVQLESDEATSHGSSQEAFAVDSEPNTITPPWDILRSITRFATIPVRQVMTPRLSMVTLSDTDSFHHVMDQINKAGYSRYPVLTQGTEQIMGTLFIKDLLAHVAESEHYPWQSLLRKPYYVPEVKKIDELLRDFQSAKTHMALVVDELGGLRGLVTLEDVIEEIVGEIPDEFDAARPAAYRQLEDGSYEFEGAIPLNDMLRIMALDPSPFAELRGTAETLAGLLLELAGKMPRNGEKFDAAGVRFTVKAVGTRLVKRVHVSSRGEQN